MSPNDARRRGVAEAQASTPGSSDALPAPHPGFIWLYVLVLVLFPLVLHLADSFQAYLFARKILSTVGPNVSPVDAIAVAREATNTTTGITGVTRSIFTYTILLLLGMSVFHILVAFGNVGAADNILTVLAGAVSSIIGFYFGTKATKEGAEPKKKSVMRELPGTITAVQPKDPEQGQEVTIMGTGFGDTEGAVKVGDHVADIVQWDHNQIKVRVPGNCRPGKTPISVNPTNDREIVGPNGVIDVHQKQ